MAGFSGINTVAQAIAEEFALDFVTVREKARVLRDAGLIAKQKGGRGGGNLSLRESAYLLLSAAGTASRQHSARPVLEHGACFAEAPEWELQFAGLPRVRQLRKGHTLADLVEALIASAVTGDVDPHTGTIKVADADPRHRLSVQIAMSEPAIRTEVRIGVQEWSSEYEVVLPAQEVAKVYQFTIGADGTFYPPFSVSADFDSDLKHQHTFSERAIFAVAKAIKNH